MKAEGAALSPEQKIAVAQLLSGRKLGEPSPYQNPVCSPETGAIDMAQPPQTQNWGLQISNTRLIPKEAAGVTKTSADRLTLKWAFAFPDANRARSQPTVAGGSVFVGSHDGRVYALDKETGCIRWTFQASAEVRTGIALDGWSADNIDAAPLAYFGDILGNIYAVNARTGEQVWRQRPEEQPNITITGTPALFEGRLYVPVSSLKSYRPPFRTMNAAHSAVQSSRMTPRPGTKSGPHTQSKRSRHPKARTPSERQALAPQGPAFGTAPRSMQNAAKSMWARPKISRRRRR